jgi:hypothetical protein
MELAVEIDVQRVLRGRARVQDPALERVLVRLSRPEDVRDEQDLARPRVQNGQVV